ncbi:hypothetical protein HD806DRAFT_552514 [Xylariaceae sp. AK1471]|nr:hypothetical protein HD806DRAFT_552514 [Xylariaceae sp. AK1471]
MSYQPVLVVPQQQRQLVWQPAQQPSQGHNQVTHRDGHQSQNQNQNLHVYSYPNHVVRAIVDHRSTTHGQGWTTQTFTTYIVEMQPYHLGPLPPHAPHPPQPPQPLLLPPPPHCQYYGEQDGWMVTGSLVKED